MAKTIKSKKIPVWAKEAPCKPALFPLAKEDGMVSWSWFPWFSKLVLLFFLSIFMILVGLLMMALGKAAGGVFVLLFLGVLPTWALLTWRWNTNKQDAYTLARGKSRQAKDLWSKVDPSFYFQAKDTFFETKYGGKTLRVLRDGTIEIMGLHNGFEGAIGGGGGEGGGGEGEGFEADATEAAEGTEVPYGGGEL